MPTFDTPQEIEARQLDGIRQLIAHIDPGNPFYAPRVQEAGLSRGVDSLEEFREKIPFTDKSELAIDQEKNPPYGTNLSQPLTAYTRLHQTSSTTGKPLRWLDTTASWSWMVDGWVEVLRAAGVTAEDRVMVAFSFGPFIGLWLGFEAAARIGCLTIPGGAMNSETRLKAILANEATVLCCTPTYALRLGDVALEQDIDLSRSKVRKIVVGGEPGASVPATRALIESRWAGARLFDHYGMTEAGPVTFQCTEDASVVHALEAYHYCEVIDPATGAPSAPDSDDLGELVLTNLGRLGSPVLRYRTGDLVRARRGACACGRHNLSFAGGILGRADDMIQVRGVNLYPTAIDQIVRGCEEITEYRVEIRTERGMTELDVQIECAPGTDPDGLRTRLETAFRDTYNLRIPVSAVPTDSLPRFELKAKRWVRV